MTPRCFSVQDDRSVFHRLVIAWRTSDDAATGQHAALKRATAPLPARLRPVQTTWTHAAGASRLVATLPEAGVEAWSEAVARTLHTRPDEVIRPVVVAVGPGEPEKFAAALARDLRGLEGTDHKIVSSLRQKRQEGAEHTTVIGPDPAATAGHAATFVALSALLAGPCRTLQDVLQGAGLPAAATLRRRLVNGTPAVAWTFAVPAGADGRGIYDVIDVVGDFARDVVAEPQPAIAFAGANLRRAWQSPSGLAETIATYEVMGWGGCIVHAPDTAVRDAAPNLRAAFVGLLEPLTEVLGAAA